jgi:hypothetical protein
LSPGGNREGDGSLAALKASTEDLEQIRAFAEILTATAARYQHIGH